MARWLHQSVLQGGLGGGWKNDSGPHTGLEEPYNLMRFLLPGRV